MNFNDARIIVRDYISDLTADVDQHIVDAVNFLSFVFPKNKIDTSKVTIKDQDYIEKPDNCLEVTKLEIDGEIIEKTSFDNLREKEKLETNFWYEYNDKIQLSQKMKEDGQEIKIWYRASFIVDAGKEWKEIQPVGNSDHCWRIASDADGSNLLAGNDGRLYISSDFGETWKETQPAGDVNKQWWALASDDDGSNLIAGISGGRLYTSSDSGATWTERQPAGDSDHDWEGAASDADGSNLIACANGGRLYTSSDSGLTWTERQPAGDSNHDWEGVTSDDDGSNLIAGIDNGRLYTSSDFGATWTERRPNGEDWDYDWDSVASDSDGSNLIVADNYDGRLYISSDFGETWKETQPAGDYDENWNSVASDDDGSNLIACARGGRLYTSSDFGETWEETFGCSLSADWYSVASDSKGINLIAGLCPGRLFRRSINLEINVEDEYGELIYVGAAYRYFRNIVSDRVTDPTGTYAEIDLDELRKVLEQWQADYYKLLENFIKNKDTR